MWKEAITFTDYDGTEKTKDFYFNLNEAEVIEMETKDNKGITDIYNRIKETNDYEQLVKEFQYLILKSYCEKIEGTDGTRLYKKRNGHMLCDDFEASAAYPALFMKLSNDTDAATAFANGILATVVDKSKLAKATSKIEIIE